MKLRPIGSWANAANKWKVADYGDLPIVSTFAQRLTKLAFDKRWDDPSDVPKYLGGESKAKLLEKLNPSSPEVAFVGRSNSGKSTLINMLIGYEQRNGAMAKKNKAAVSNTPGKTRRVQMYGVCPMKGWNKKPDLPAYTVVLADLPGYGYARGSKDQIAQMNKVYDVYFEERCRENSFFSKVFLLIDPRRGLLDSDRQMLEYFALNGIKNQIVLTKLDMLPVGTLQTDEKTGLSLNKEIRDILIELEDTTYLSTYPEVLGTSNCIRSYPRGFFGVQNLQQAIIQSVEHLYTERARDLYDKKFSKKDY